MAKAHPTNFIDLTGKRFGKLVPVSYSGHRSGGSHWNCLCDCGNPHIATTSNLTTGRTKSCGCSRFKSGKESGTFKHGMTSRPEFRIWARIIARCTNPNFMQYRHYGARGIKVCDRWLSSFQSFFDDMGPRPSAKHSIDRIDNNGNYEPGNCRWATMTQQARNRRSSRLITHEGITATVAEWSERAGLKVATLYRRINAGWSVSDALNPQLKAGPYNRH